jgi:hypothetical protein
VKGDGLLNLGGVSTSAQWEHASLPRNVTGQADAHIVFHIMSQSWSVEPHSHRRVWRSFQHRRVSNHLKPVQNQKCISSTGAMA